MAISNFSFRRAVSGRSSGNLLSILYFCRISHNRDNKSYLKEDKSKYIESITKYTGSYYPRINQYLRGQRKELDNETISVIDGISNYINLSDKYVGKSYRGITTDRTMFDKLKSLKKGDDYIENGFDLS